MLSLTCLIMPIDKVITQTIFLVLFTSGSLLTWDRPLDALSGISPQIFICYLLSINYIPLFYRYYMMTDYASFCKVLTGGGRTLPCYGEHLNICPSLQQFHISSITQSELSSLTGLKAWGDKGKFCNDITFLLVSAKEEAIGDRKYGLSTIWVNPCQARVHSMEEVVRELTVWVSSGPNWP